MGTNYYHISGPPEAIERLHIGKSSGGWCFSLHIYPQLGINDLPDWIERWMDGGIIQDEYGGAVSNQEMLDRITKREWSGSAIKDRDFLRINHAVAGPKGLMRTELGIGCVKHGEGTWDCVVND